MKFCEITAVPLGFQPQCVSVKANHRFHITRQYTTSKSYFVTFHGYLLLHCYQVFILKNQFHTVSHGGTESRRSAGYAE